MLSLLSQSPISFGVMLLALILCLAIHEFAHAYMAYKLGDDTAKYLGRLTLNPLNHIDPWGLLFLVVAGFGWGKPVPFNPYNLRHPKRDAALIAFAGPTANFLLAAVVAGIAHSFTSPLLTPLFVALIYYNLVLGIFNLLPVYPLDGFTVLNGFLPEELSQNWLQTQRYGMVILLLLIFTNATDKIVFPLVSLGARLLGF